MLNDYFLCQILFRFPADSHIEYKLKNSYLVHIFDELYNFLFIVE